jgi:hypothetical protein
VLQDVSVRLGVAAVVVLLAAVVRGWPVLIPPAIVLACGSYATELAIDDAPLDVLAPVLAAAVLVTAELAYWSIEERARTVSDPGEELRHGAFVAALGLGGLGLGALLLGLVDAVHARSLALDVSGTIAAAAALVVIVAIGRGRARPAE